MSKQSKPSIRVAISNWSESELPVARRFAVALRNWSRRFRIPPRDCCGNDGQPGC